jgi:hypothetical protein
MTAAATITVRVPLTIRRRGELTLVVAPDGAQDWSPPRARIDNTLIKALARAFRWKRMLEDGRYASITDIARAEKLDRTYVGDILRLTLLAPEIVEAIVAGRQSAKMTLPVLMKGFAVEWNEQNAGS